MGNTRAEIELGRKITEARAADTVRQKEAWARKQQADRDEDEVRMEEIRALGRNYEIAKPVVPVAPLPPPTEEEIEAAVRRKRGK
jgi:hypothetical protein